VKLVGDFRIIVACALVWALLAAVCLALATVLDAQVPIWLPAGLSVAQFGLLPKRRWLLSAAVLGPVSFAVLFASGASVPYATVFALATLAEGMICAALGLWAMQGNVQLPDGPRQVLGLYGAAFAGSFGYALVMLPVTFSGGGGAITTGLFAHLLGMLTMTSLVLHGRKRLLQPDASDGPKLTNELAWTMAFVATLSIVLLQAESYLLVPILLTGLILATIRLPAPAPALNVLLVAAIATLFSIGGRSPLPNLASDPAEAMLLIQTWLALSLATAVPIASIIARRDDMANQLAMQNAQLEENVTVFGLAEELAEIGRWQLDLTSGKQIYSPVMYELLGMDADLAGEGDDIRDLLQGGGETVFDELERNCRENAAYSFDCRIKPVDGPERILRFSAQNIFDPAGMRKSVFAVAMDVTGQVRREEALDLARGRAVRLAAEAQKLANTDVLTELPNRRCSLGLLERLVDQGHRDNTNLSVLLFDIDHFKKVNDTYGHKAGDDVLLRVASLARREMRGSDLVGRIGGEEFVCLMPGLGPNDARALAERLRAAIAADSGVQGLPPVTVSVGIACLGPNDDAGSLLARADEALYGAKAGGRNQVRRAA